jgi:hypothetical protein
VKAALVFVTQPSTTQPGGAFIPTVEVAIVDRTGAVVKTATDTIRLLIDYGGGSISRTPFGDTEVAQHGVARFELATARESGHGVRLIASATGFPSVTSDSFTVNYYIGIAAGRRHFCALTDLKAIYCWGANDKGALGDGTTTLRTAPVRVSGGVLFDSLTAGDDHACALTASGAAFCWGANADGQLGDGTTIERHSPVPVAGGLAFRSITAGGAQTCGLTSTGAAYCWGSSVPGAPAPKTMPTQVTGGPFVRLAVRGSGVCGVSTAPIFAAVASVSCWDVASLHAEIVSVAYSLVPEVWGGFQEFCQQYSELLSCWTTDPSALSSVPVSNLRIVHVAIGGRHICLNDFYDHAYCWGVNANGQVGDGTRLDAPSPVDITASFGGTGVFRIASAESATCAVSGRVYCWGSNSAGQLGLGVPIDSLPNDRVRPGVVRFP